MKTWKKAAFGTYAVGAVVFGGVDYAISRKTRRKQRARIKEAAINGLLWPTVVTEAASGMFIEAIGVDQ